MATSSEESTGIGKGAMPSADAPAVEFSLLRLANIILRRRRLILIVGAIAGLAGLFAAITRERMYVATGAFLPNVQTREVPGQGLARQLGIGVVAGPPGESPSFYLELLNGRELLRALVAREYDYQGRRVALIEILELGAEGVRPSWQAAVDQIRSQMEVTYKSETGVIRVLARASDEKLAEQIVRAAIDLVNEFNLRTRASRGREEARFVAERLAEAERDLARAETEVKGFLTQNREFRNSPELTFEHDRMQREFQFRREVFESLAQSLERARIDIIRDVPVLTVVESPEGWAWRESGNVPRAIGIPLVLGLLLGGMIAVVTAVNQRPGLTEDVDHREFQRLRRAAVADLVRPWRLFRARAKSSRD